MDAPSNISIVNLGLLKVSGQVELKCKKERGLDLVEIKSKVPIAIKQKPFRFLIKIF